MNKQKVSGLIMVIVGFIMLILNAIGYLFEAGIKSSAFTVIGLVFVLIGLKTIRKK